MYFTILNQKRRKPSYIVEKQLFSCFFLVFCSFLRIFQENIILYPNPSTDMDTIKFLGFTNQNVLITLYDIQGRKIRTVFDGKINNEQHRMELNISDLKQGVYLYDIRSATEKRTLRFLKYE
jgi:hypothetical protein